MSSTLIVTIAAVALLLGVGAGTWFVLRARRSRDGESPIELDDTQDGEEVSDEPSV